MPANNSGMLVGYLAGTYPGKIGWLLSADGWREPHDWLPYALDNGAFPAYAKGIEWKEGPFYSLLERTIGRTHKPRWVAVPDVVTNREATLLSWFAHCARVAAYRIPLAFVVQDGMTPDDVPANADVVFVGGSTDWKWRTLRTWTDNFQRVHVGRVNGERGLWLCHDAGVESCDGTGWMRGDKKQLAGLLSYLAHSTNGTRIVQQTLF